MTGSASDSELDSAEALRQLALDHQRGHLSLPDYRRLRRELLDRLSNGETITTPPADRSPSGRRPGIVVWVAITAMVVLLAIVGWLLR